MKSWHKVGHRPRRRPWTRGEWLALAVLVFSFIIAPALMAGIIGE